MQGQTLTKPTDINEADIRPLLLALAAQMNVVLWRNTEQGTGETSFEIIPLTK